MRHHKSAIGPIRFDVFSLTIFLLSNVDGLALSNLAQAAPSQQAPNGSADVGPTAIFVILAVSVIFGIYFRIKDRRRRQLIASGKLPVIIRRYAGTESESHAAFQKNAVGMAAHSYFPTSQSWAPGQWGVGSFIIAFLLCFILIGFIVFVYMLIVKPSGTLTVTYELRAKAAAEKTCPKCAEKIKAAALLCHYCGEEFIVEQETDELISVRREPLSEPPRRISVKAVVASLVVVGLTIGVAAIGISNRSIKTDAPIYPTNIGNTKDEVVQQKLVQISRQVAAPTTQQPPLSNDPLKEGLVAYQRGDYTTAIQAWQPIAEQGSAVVQFNLGIMHAKGQGVPQDYAAAIRWFRRAADQGNADAQYSLGSFYVEGKGPAQNYGEAQKWYRKAAEQGNASAQYELGVIYAHGLGVLTNYSEALQWFRKAADQGNGDAQHNLGIMYSSGRGVPQNYATAASWYRKAADQGVADSQNNLGLMYENGYGVKKNSTEALRWYQKAADQGNEQAKKNFASLYARVAR